MNQSAQRAFGIERPMFKIQQRKNVDETVGYFLHDKELSTEEKQGVWIGRGVDDLWTKRSDGGGQSPPAYRSGITSGRRLVVEQDLRTILRGYAPESTQFPGRPLNRRYLAEGVRRCAWDGVLSAHKSVSVAALCLPDEFTEQKLAVRSAYGSAIQECFQFIERLARRVNGRGPDIETKSLLAACFDHHASRRDDPHFHTHLLLMNATFDSSRSPYKRWHALESLQYYRQAREIDVVFQRALAWHLHASGFDAKLEQVDGLPVAVLPAVAPAICRRLSRAHVEIQKKVDGQWNREEREITHKRTENLYNDCLRPSKGGSLLRQQALFSNALSREEALAIISTLPTTIPRPGVGLPMPSSEEIIDDVFEAGLRLGYDRADPTRITRAALYASAERMDMPFDPYWDLAEKHLGWLLSGQTFARTWIDHGLAVKRHWQAEMEDMLRLEEANRAMLNQIQSPQTECTPSRSSSKHERPSAPPAHEIVPGPAAVGSALGKLPLSAAPDVVSPYLLPADPSPPEDQQDEQGLSL